MNDQATRHQWIERALDGIERFSNSTLTTDQKNAINVQFGVLMDQLDVAVGAIEFCEITSSFENADKFPRCMELIQASSKQALEQLKSSKFSI